MRMAMAWGWALAGLGAVGAVPPDKAMLEALRPYAPFVGKWEGDGSSEKLGDWKQKLEAGWAFREEDGRASLDFTAEGGTLLKIGRLTFNPETKEYRFALKNKADAKLEFVGKALEDGTLRLERKEGDGADRLDRLEIKLVRGNDKALLDFRRKRGVSSFESQAKLELFRPGGPEASAEKFEKGPFCVVTGGPGRVEVQHQGKTIHVADEACKEEYLAHPDRYPAP